MPCTTLDYITQSKSCMTHAKAVMTQASHVCDEATRHVMGAHMVERDAGAGNDMASELQRECKAVQDRVHEVVAALLRAVDGVQP